MVSLRKTREDKGEVVQMSGGEVWLPWLPVLLLHGRKRQAEAKSGPGGAAIFYGD